MHTAALSAFVDELEKIAISHGRMHVSKERTGRRSMSVTTMLKKDAKGALLKKHADAAGSPQDVRGDSVDDPGAARSPRRPGEGPSQGTGNIPQSAKTGGTPLSARIARLLERKPYLKHAAGGASYRLTDTTIPFSWGEDMRAGNSKPLQTGDVPTQENMSVDGPIARGSSLPSRRVAISMDPGAKGIKKGDTPTRTDDINKVDRYDQRDNATTVTGLAQNSTGIGAFNSPAEHT